MEVPRGTRGSRLRAAIRRCQRTRRSDRRQGRHRRGRELGHASIRGLRGLVGDSSDSSEDPTAGLKPARFPSREAGMGTRLHGDGRRDGARTVAGTRVPPPTSLPPVPSWISAATPHTQTLNCPRIDRGSGISQRLVAEEALRSGARIPHVRSKQRLSRSLALPRPAARG